MVQSGNNIYTPSSRKRQTRASVLLVAEILHQLIGSLSQYLQGFIHPRWCRISAINSMEVNFRLTKKIKNMKLLPCFHHLDNFWTLRSNPPSPKAHLGGGSIWKNLSQNLFIFPNFRGEAFQKRIWNQQRTTLHSLIQKLENSWQIGPKNASKRIGNFQPTIHFQVGKLGRNFREGNFRWMFGALGFPPRARGSERFGSSQLVSRSFSEPTITNHGLLTTYRLVNWHSNAKWTLWRCISY